MATRIIKGDDKQLREVDFAALNGKRDFELFRLDEVITYTRAAGCRQKYIIEYFGESASDWQCDACDHCHGLELWRDATKREMEIAAVILETASGFRGRIGRNKLSLLLSGGKRLEMVSSRLLEHAMFGALDMLKPRDIMQFLQSLEAQGLLEAVTETEFPCVDISAAGRKWLLLPTNIKMNFPPLAASGYMGKSVPGHGGSAAVADSLDNKQSSLFEELRRLRSEMAHKKGIPAYQILPDATLKLLASVAPRTTAEAMQIRGIGPAKAATVLPKMLEAIREWDKKS